MSRLCIVPVSMVLLGALTFSPEVSAQSSAVYRTSVQPLFVKNCFACHNEKMKSGDLNLQAFASSPAVAENRDKWETIHRRLVAGEMPPVGLPRPDAAELKATTNWIQGELNRTQRAVKPQAGRVTARRLNRSEYNNTIRDLLAVDFRPADDFPQDDSGYGFDVIGDSLSLSPVLMEKYLGAAEKVVQTALFGPGTVKPTVVRHQPPYRVGTDGGDNSRFSKALPFTITNYDVTGLALPSALHTMHRFPATGEYVFRIDPEGNRPRPSDDFQVAVWIDGKQAGTVTYEATAAATSLEGEDRTIKLRVEGGEHWVAVSALRLYEGLPATYGGLKPTTRPAPPAQDPGAFLTAKPNATPEELKELEERRKTFAARQRLRNNKPPDITDISFRVNFVEISGPFEPDTKASAASRRLILACDHTDPGQHTAACPRKVLTNMARRAWRRPVTTQEITRLLALVEQDRKRGSSLEEAMGTGLEAILVSPQFLFRVERDPKPTGADAEHAVTEYELASRMASFFWSSVPDDELMRLAEAKTLRRPEVLEAQVRRMVQDQKSKRLVEDFGGQWLQFRGLESVRPDINRFGKFDDYIRMSMRQETSLFLNHVIRQDRPVTELLNGKYTFLNEALAQFYGVSGVSGPEFRKVDLTGTPRGGVLTHGSVLTVSSYSTRTSVVLRGKWVLENLLNAPVPPPPPDVPTLDESTVGTSMSLRQQMEKHRTNAVCASCHSRMDPLGFGLENFDAIGQWRSEDGKFPIDASGTLPDGRTFQGPSELISVLSEQKDAFASAMTEKMLTYALGRGLETYDRPTIRAITKRLAESDYKFSTLALEIVKSLPFQARKGDRMVSLAGDIKANADHR